MLLIKIKMEENIIPEWNDFLCIGHSLLDTKILEDWDMSYFFM